MTEHHDGGDGDDRQSANLARHLNEQHPGTVLLIARYAPGGRPDATTAEVTGVDGGGLALTVAVPEGRAVLGVALPHGPDVRSRIAALVVATRAALPDDGSIPPTSLEHRLAGGGHGPTPHGPPRAATPREGT